MKKSLLVLSVLAGAILLLSNFTTRPDVAQPFHTPEELEVLKQQLQTPIGPGQYFQPSTSCQGCHGYDTLMQANIDENGNDVNLFDRWASSMMAFSAKDPFWRAKVSHETLVNPGHATALQTKCTSCHAPMGHYTAFFHGDTTYTITDLISDSLGLDGVSCAGCHTISPQTGNSFSGLIAYDTTRNIYGPFPGPFTGPMQLYEGYTPNYGPHMDNSAVCSSCHTLITKSVDLNGVYTGGEFVEQATYHEFLNSSYPLAGTKCQTCHMPQLADPIVIANGYITLAGRTPFNQHVFAGANQFMLDLIKNNKNSLGITVSDSQFDSTLTATLEMLQQKSVEFELSNDSVAHDTAYYHVRIKNKAGHKFPSGYPSRRAVLQLVMTDITSDTVFQSGIFDSNFRVIGESSQYEPHYNIISQNNVSQIYELVMGDVNGQYTSLLERAATLLKDNRIPPDGFTTAAPMYDTVQISADALADPDFNKVSGIEGNATDFVNFRIPVSGINGTVKVTARLYYQSVPPKFLDEMFSMNSAPIDSFRNMYTAADKTPVLVAADSLTEVITGTDAPAGSAVIHIWPTVTPDGWIHFTGTTGNRMEAVEVFDVKGKLIQSKKIQDIKDESLQLPDAKGIYMIRIRLKSGTQTSKVLRM